MLEEDPEPASDLDDVVIDKRGEGQPCPEKRAADSAMDTPVGMVASAPSPDAAAPPTEDPERADDCHDIILDERGEDQPCPAGTAADSAMDTPAEVVANALSLDAAALPMEEALGEHMPPTSGPTKTLETQDLGVEDTVVLLHEKEMTDFP